MRIRVLGGGMYGCHLASALDSLDHYVELHEIADRLFNAASGNMPARLHQGQHYPRSKLTRAACQEHHADFMARYGDFTRGVPINIYAVAEHDSLVDFGTYKQVLKGEIEYISIERPEEFGLQNVEGALLTGERHILVDKMRGYFAEKLKDLVHYGRPPGEVDDPTWDLTLDCTFCRNDAINVDRFEACLTVLLEGPTDRAITIMDGPFPSLYPWDEERGLSSLTSAMWTPIARLPTYKDAMMDLTRPGSAEIAHDRAKKMYDQMSHYYPRLIDDYGIADHRIAIRAMPRSASDARLVDTIRVGERAVRIRAGKLDAIFHAERVITEMLPEFER